MTDQDIDGKVPPEAAAGAPAAPGDGPETLEQQLAKEREARAQMRDRLRHTEALAAESHALRARMAQELERVTADRDRLRREAAAAPAPAATTAPAPSASSAAGQAAPRPAAPRAVEPALTSAGATFKASHAADRPLKPPAPASRKGPWGALAMLSVLALAVSAVAWYRGSLPGAKDLQAAFSPAPTQPAAPSTGEAAPPAPPVATAVPPAQTAVAAAPPAASVAVATATPATGAVALPPMAPDAQLAATPPAAGPPPSSSPAGMSPADMSERLRKALDGEGIASAVDIDAATGRVRVADPQADGAQRQRTEMLIRAVYAGAGQPEPQIEHRWLSPMRGARQTTAPTGAPIAAAAAPAAPTPAAAYAARHARAAERRRPAEVSVAEAEELTPVLPAGRVTASCMEGLAGKSTARRASMTACMKHSCCSSAANHNSEECRAYARAFPFTCGPG